MWATHRAWIAVMQELGITTDVRAWDLRGSGEWPERSGPYNPHRMDALR
jgi:hypothetical protein